MIILSKYEAIGFQDILTKTTVLFNWIFFFFFLKQAELEMII